MDLNEIIDRKNTHSMKYDSAQAFEKRDGLIPLWVADMDFRAPETVRNRLREMSDFGIYGYSFYRDDYRKAVADWFTDHHGYTPDQEYMVQTPGVVSALALAVRVFTEPGDPVMINRPVYYPFSNVITANDRRIVNSPLVEKDLEYSLDFDDIEKKIVENDIKLYLLCSPHNPVSRVWTREELTRLSEICLKHGVFVVSDEIHCDFTFNGSTHTMYASLSPEAEKNSMTCTAASKTFNLAGLENANIFIPDPDRRKAYRKELARIGHEHTNMMGMAATMEAYRTGQPWLTEIKNYIKANADYVRTALSDTPVRLAPHMGTYLLWLDFRALELTDEALEKLIDNAGLWLDGGTMFGPEGSGFQRINAACPRQVLEKAISQLKAELSKL